MSSGVVPNFSLMQVGYCCHPEAMIARGKSLRNIIFPAIVALLKHPVEGYILFDTGYASHFHQVTGCFPEKIYRMVTPVTYESSQSLQVQLYQKGIKVEEIHYIFISHFHADHIAGLKDFPNAQFICSKAGFDFINGKCSTLYKLTKATLPALLPENFLQRTTFIEEKSLGVLSKCLQPFKYGYDLFGDGCCIAIGLPGHARGHFGLLFNIPENQPYFLIGDACWTKETLVKQIKPNPLSHLILDNSIEYYQTINQLNSLLNNNLDINLIPSHCLKTFHDYE